VDARKTQRRLAEQAVDQLRRAQATIFGVVVNRVDPGPFTSGYYAEGPPPEQQDSRRGRATESSR
jgi:hypothetical protein